MSLDDGNGSDYFVNAPPEIWRSFLLHLSPSDLYSLSQTSSTALRMCSTHIRFLCLDQKTEIPKLAFLTKRCFNLSALHVTDAHGFSAFLSGIEVHTLKSLKELVIGGISRVEELAALVLILRNCVNLEALELSFSAPNEYDPSTIELKEAIKTFEDAIHLHMMSRDQEIEKFQTSPSKDESTTPLCFKSVTQPIYLPKLHILRHRNAPESWLGLFEENFFWTPLVRSVEFVLVRAPKNLKFLQSFNGNNLEILRLSISEDSKIDNKLANEFRAENTVDVADVAQQRNQDPNIDRANAGFCEVYDIPIKFKALKIFSARNFCFRPSSLKKQVGETLVSLEFTPWYWKRRDLQIFSEMPRLERLWMRVNWLPNAEFLERCFCHIRVLTLVEFDVYRSTSLYNLRNLVHLGFDSPSKGEKVASPKNFGHIVEALYNMPWLSSFALTNVTHITKGLKTAILSSDVLALREIELSGCDACLQSFIDDSNAKGEAQFTRVALHLQPSFYSEGAVLEWTENEEVFNTIYSVDYEHNRPLRSYC